MVWFYIPSSCAPVSECSTSRADEVCFRRSGMNPTYRHAPCRCGYYLVTGQRFDDGPDGKPKPVRLQWCPRCGYSRDEVKARKITAPGWEIYETDRGAA